MNNEKQLEKLNILLVDENRDSASLILDQLIQVSHLIKTDVSILQSLTEACHSLESNKYSVLLLCFNSPVHSIPESITLISEIAPEMPVIVLASYVDESLGCDAIQAGAQNYLFKEELTGPILSRTILHSIEHKKQLLQLSNHNETLQAFAKAVSHDLKAPLSNIKMISELVIEEVGNSLDSTITDMLQSLPVITNRMKILIEDLLHFSLVGQRGLEPDYISLYGAIKVASKLLELQIRNQNATINIGHLDEVYADGSLLTSVFQNLISNACKYVKDAPPIINISTKIDAGSVIVMVQDNGIGISEKEHTRIFNPLIRAVNTADYEGTGLGLSIVKKIIEAHQGRVWVESTPGKGSTFFFSLPQADPSVSSGFLNPTSLQSDPAY